VGDHTGYAYGEANGPQEALEDFVPVELRKRARAHRLSTIRAEELSCRRESEGTRSRGC
jgi:hypothetical protein